MDTTLVIPPSATLSADTLVKLTDFIDEWEFAEDWDDPVADLSTLAYSIPTRLKSREGNQKCVDAAMKLAKEEGIPLAVHLDSCNESDCSEWNHRSFLTWFNPKTGETSEKGAPTLDIEPELPYSQVIKLPNNPHLQEELLAEVEVLTTLGILK